MKPIRTWILVADGTRARFLENLGPGKGIAPALDHDMQQQLPPDRELTRDKSGHGAGPGGDAHGVAPRVDRHAFEKERFAHEVARVVNKARAEHRFDRLVVAAPPKELGHLRRELDDKTRSTVTAELNKDLVDARDDELVAHLGEVMAV